MIEQFQFMFAPLAALLSTLVRTEPALPYHTIRLHGNFTLGYYYATIYMGTPLRPQTLITDTGSHITAVPCSNCTYCGTHHINKFHSVNSTSFRPLNCKSDSCRCGGEHFKNSCDFQVGYAEGSFYSGFMFSEQVVLGDELYSQVESGSGGPLVAAQSVTAKMGCVMKETNMFFTQEANGIIGLNKKMETNLFALTYEQHTKFTHEKPGFSLCYGYDGGMMTIGGVNLSHVDPSSPLRLTTGASDMYDARLNSVRLNNESLAAAGKTIFDSGTTYTFFNGDLYSSLMSRLDQICKNRTPGCKLATIGIDNCHIFSDLNESQLMRHKMLEIAKSYPVLEFEFEEGNVSWSPLDYLLPLSNHSLCSAFSQYGYNMLGTTFFRHRNIYFDAKSSTIQITSANCTQNLEEDFFRQLVKLNQSMRLSDRPSVQQSHTIVVGPKAQGEAALILALCVSASLLFLLVGYCIFKCKRRQSQQLLKNPNKIISQSIELSQQQGN